MIPALASRSHPPVTLSRELFAARLVAYSRDSPPQSPAWHRSPPFSNIFIRTVPFCLSPPFHFQEVYRRPRVPLYPCVPVPPLLSSPICPFRLFPWSPTELFFLSSRCDPSFISLISRRSLLNHLFPCSSLLEASSPNTESLATPAPWH